MLAPEPVRWLQVLDSLCDFSIRDPALQICLALASTLPLKDNVVETLLLLWDRELHVGPRHVFRNQIRDVSLDEMPLLFLRRQLHLDFLLFYFFLHLCILLFLRLFLCRLLGRSFLLGRTFLSLFLFPGFGLGPLGLLHGLLSLLLGRLPFSLRLLGGLLLRHLHLLSSRLPLGPVLLLLECVLVDKVLEVGWGLSNHHPSHLVEVAARKSIQQLLPAALQEAVLDLHDDVVARQQRRDHGNDLLQTEVIHTRQAKAKLGLVVTRPFRIAPLSRQAALVGPIQNGPVAELDIVPVLRQEAVQPIERTLVGQTDGHDDLVLSVLFRSLPHHAVRDQCLLHGQALERQRPQG
mmetsp:Transcript_152033/g.488143  ORF Transcript_152033/g.488143 Transcript_152033/m.488143 type:complete len:350 (-) Transcript_152033:944-1993(-)